MVKILRSSYIKLVLGLFFLLLITSLSAQEENKTALKSYLFQLEEKYNIKFSFVDEDLSGVTITVSNLNNLNSILTALESETKLKIEKLNNRYYTITKSTLVNICANVFDNYAENTIPGATVEVVESAIAKITNSDGSFTLKNISRTATLKVRYLGFITKYIPVEQIANKSNCPNILMSQNLEILDEVVVYKFLTSGLVRETDASITLKPAKQGILPGLVEPDILQSVQALPGIKSIDETVSDINVRGGTNDQNLILWNGIKMYQSGHFFGLISAFNPYQVDNISVYKNGTPTQFGDGVSSVISLETKNDIDSEISGGAGLNLISGDVYGQFPINDKVAFQFSARRSITDFLKTPTYNSFTMRAFQDSEVQNQNNDENISRDENFFFYDITAKLLYNINQNQKLRLSFIGMENYLFYTETDLMTNEKSQSALEQQNLSVGAQLESKWTDRFSTHLNMYVTYYDLYAENSPENQIQILEQRNFIVENALKLNSTFQVSDYLNWQNGYQFTNTGVQNVTRVNQPSFTSEVSGIIQIHAPYTQINYTSLENKFIASGGLRVNYVESKDTFSKWLLEPRLNINFRVAKNLRAQVLGEIKSQTTNQIIDLEQNFLGIEKRRWIISDEGRLPITKSKQGSAGLNYEKNSFYIGLEGFYKEVDGISTRTQGFQNENQFINNGEIGIYKVKGLEFLINKRGSNYSTWLSYAYNKNDYTFDNLVPSTFPNNLDISHTLTVASTYNIKKLKLGVGFNYRTGKPYTEPQEGDLALDTTIFPNRINYKAPNSRRLTEYFRADASASYSFNLSRGLKANTSISLLNLTNRKNVLNQYYRGSEDNEIETVINSSLGITPNMSFRVSF